MTRTRAFVLGLLPALALLVWITGVGGWIGFWHDSVQWWREVTGVVPTMCVVTEPARDRG